MPASSCITDMLLPSSYIFGQKHRWSWVLTCLLWQAQ